MESTVPPEVVDAYAKHEQECGCILPVNRVPQATPMASIGYIPFPMEFPSNRQARTTKSYGPRARHPTNTIKEERYKPITNPYLVGTGTLSASVLPRVNVQIALAGLGTLGAT
jgi:hypothetical protein